MSRFFSSSTARAVRKWLGYPRENLTPTWKSAVEKFTAPRGSAEQRLGPIDTATIKSRAEGPVHASLFNPTDKENVISVRIKGENDTKTCHVYEDGTGTIKKDGQRD